jgi:Flp pilus assembly protein TadG
MSKNRRRGWWRRLAGGERGIVATEFVLITPILLALLFGIIDFGYAFFMKQMLTNAAREGARYGVVYRSPKPTLTDLQTGIQTVVTSYLAGAGITVPASNVTVTGAGMATGTPLQVAVKATKNWWLVSFITGESSTDIYGISTMNNE